MQRGGGGLSRYGDSDEGQEWRLIHALRPPPEATEAGGAREAETAAVPPPPEGTPPEGASLKRKVPSAAEVTRLQLEWRGSPFLLQHSRGAISSQSLRNIGKPSG